MEAVTVRKISVSFLVYIFKLSKGARFDHDQVKEEDVMRN